MCQWEKFLRSVPVGKKHFLRMYQNYKKILKCASGKDF